MLDKETYIKTLEDIIANFIKPLNRRLYSNEHGAKILAEGEIPL